MMNLKLSTNNLFFTMRIFIFITKTHFCDHYGKNSIKCLNNSGRTHTYIYTCMYIAPVQVKRKKMCKSILFSSASVAGNNNKIKR